MDMHESWIFLWLKFFGWRIAILDSDSDWMRNIFFSLGKQKYEDSNIAIVKWCRECACDFAKSRRMQEKFTCKFLHYETRMIEFEWQNCGDSPSAIHHRIVSTSIKTPEMTIAHKFSINFLLHSSEHEGTRRPSRNKCWAHAHHQI